MRLYEIKNHDESLDLVSVEHSSIQSLISKCFIIKEKPSKFAKLVTTYTGPALINARKKYETHYHELVNIFKRSFPGATTTITHSQLQPIISEIDNYIQTSIIDTANQPLPCRVVSFGNRKGGDVTGAICGIRVIGMKIDIRLSINYSTVLKQVGNSVVLFIQLLLSTIMHEFTHYLQFNQMFANQPISQVTAYLLNFDRNDRHQKLMGKITLMHASMDLAEIKSVLSQYKYNASELEIQAWSVQATIELLEHASSSEIRQILNNRYLPASDDKLTFEDQIRERPDLFRLTDYSKHFSVYLVFKAAGGDAIYDIFVDRIMEQLDLYDSGTEPMISKTYELTWS